MCIPRDLGVIDFGYLLLFFLLLLISLVLIKMPYDKTNSVNRKIGMDISSVLFFSSC